MEFTFFCDSLYMIYRCVYVLYIKFKLSSARKRLTQLKIPFQQFFSKRKCIQSILYNLYEIFMFYLHKIAIKTLLNLKIHITAKNALRAIITDRQYANQILLYVHANMNNKYYYACNHLVVNFSNVHHY